VAPTTTTTTASGAQLLLAYGDSFAALRGWPSGYAELASEQLGTAVEVDGVTCAIGCDSILGVIESDRQLDLLRSASIIVLQPKPGRVFAAPFANLLDGTCGGADGRECITESLAEFDVYLDELLDTVTAQANPDAIIRVIPAGTWALDYFYRGLRNDYPATFEVMITAMTEFVAMIHAAADARCIGVTDAGAILSGPNYRTPIDPAHTTDGAHPSKEASALIAADLHSLGYEPTAAAGC
jgi:hypothetical protein